MADMKNDTSLDDAETDAIEAGAEEVNIIEDSRTLEFITPETELVQVRGALTKAGYDIKDASILYIPNTFASLTGLEKKSLQKLVETLMNESIVTNVHTNAE